MNCSLLYPTGKTQQIPPAHSTAGLQSWLHTQLEALTTLRTQLQRWRDPTRTHSYRANNLSISFSLLPMQPMDYLGVDLLRGSRT